MDKNNSKMNTFLKTAFIVFLILFILSVASFIYFRLFFKDGDVNLSFIKFLSETVNSSMGFVYYTLIPGIFALLFLILSLISNLNQYKYIEDNIAKEDDVKMRQTPFQDVVYSSNEKSKNVDSVDDIVIQTLKSPIVSAKKNIDTNENAEKSINQHFEPEYLFNEISSIRELKEVIKKDKLPKICICSDGDLSALTQGEIEQIKKINLIDTNKIFEHIKNKNSFLYKKIKDENFKSKHTYKIVSKGCKLKKSTQPLKEKYLSADEIINLYRNYKNEKVKLSSVSDDFVEDNSAFRDMAKFYYESDIDEYKQ